MLRGELFTLSMFSLLGILVMVAANNFLVVYLGLELMSLSLYALVAMRRDDTGATEAAMKYFVLGALASGFLLYGLSMMYGATGIARDERGLQGDRHRPHQPRRARLRHRLRRRRPRASSSARCRSTCGCPTSTRARRRR